MTPITAERKPMQFAMGVSVAPRKIAQSAATRARVAERLEHLTELQFDWDGEGAQALDRLAMRVSTTFVDAMLTAGFPEPEVFPVPDGGVQFEWASGPIELEVEVTPGGRALLFVCDDESTGQQIDGMLPRDHSRFALALARLRAHS